MKKKNPPGMMLYFNIISELIGQLNDAELGMIFRAMYNYARNGENTDMPDKLKIGWGMIKNMLDMNRESYDERRLKNGYNAVVGYARMQGKPIPSFEKYKEEALRSMAVEDLPKSVVQSSAAPAPAAPAPAVTSPKESSFDEEKRRQELISMIDSYGALPMT